MDGWRVDGFTEVRELGSGAQGRVVLARHAAAGTPVAIKYLTRRPGDTQALDRLRGEAVMLGKVADPHVARLYRMVESDHGAAIIMEAVDGVSLKAILVRHNTLAPEAALLVLKGSLLGLAAAHAAGVVHRDYKPANVVVQPDGLSKLIDFGIAAYQGQATHTGTPLYMAPEQWRGEPAGPPTDVYAATCVFYECITGHRPYRADDRIALMNRHLTAPIPTDDIPDPLRPLLERGMAKEATDRPPGAQALVAELEQVAVAAYGPDWEHRGVRGLAAAAVALAALFPLAASSLGAAAGTGAAGTGVLAGVGAKVTVAVAGTAVVAAGGAGAYVATRDQPARPAAVVRPVAVNVAPETHRERWGRLTTQYIALSGMRDATAQGRINKAIRDTVDALTGPWVAGQRSLRGSPSSALFNRPTVGNASATIGARGPRLVSLYYTLTDSQATSGYIGTSRSLIFDLITGRRLGVREVLRDGVFTEAGARDLARVIARHQENAATRAQTPDGAVCFRGKGIVPADLERQRLMAQPTKDGIAFVLAENFALGCDGVDRGRETKIPYSQLGPYVRPAVIAQATATR